MITHINYSYKKWCNETTYHGFLSHQSTEWCLAIVDAECAYYDLGLATTQVKTVVHKKYARIEPIIKKQKEENNIRKGT